MKQSAVSRRGVLTSVAALPLAALPVASMVPAWPMLPKNPAAVEAAIRGQLPANNEAATKILNAVFSVIEEVYNLDPPERQKTLGIVGELLRTVETDDDLDNVYGLLNRLSQERRSAEDVEDDAEWTRLLEEELKERQALLTAAT